MAADAVRTAVTISKTVGEYDDYAFAGSSGDFSANETTSTGST